MTDEPKIAPSTTDSPQRRFGFVAMLWWVASVTGTLGVMKGGHASGLRIFMIVIGYILAVLFTFVWWQVRKGVVKP